ncbi:MAG: hypothetical protein WBQ23_07665 [Bacteroidota bacterium]
MNGNTVRAYCAQPLRFLAIISAAMLVFAACDNPPVENTTPVYSALAMPAGMPVMYGPVNKSNPFEYVGLRHNDLVHAAISAAEPWDTLSLPVMLAHFRKTIPEWSEAAMDVPRLRGIGHVQTAFALQIDSSARYQLAEFAAPGYTARELGYIRRIGTLLCNAATFSALEQGLLDIERNILAEQWPDGDRKEMYARIAISVAKHSCAYWKRMFFVAAGADPSELSKFGNSGSPGCFAKSTELLIHLVTKSETVIAADIMAATSAGEAAAALGPLKQIEAAIVSGSAVSLIVAALLYFNDVVEYIRSLCPSGSSN